MPTFLSLATHTRPERLHCYLSSSASHAHVCPGIDSGSTYDVGNVYIFKRTSVTSYNFQHVDSLVPQNSMSYDNWGRDAIVFGDGFLAAGARYSDKSMFVLCDTCACADCCVSQRAPARAASPSSSWEISTRLVMNPAFLSYLSRYVCMCCDIDQRQSVRRTMEDVRAVN